MRPPNRPARALAALCLVAAPLAACAEDPEHGDVVAPIVLTEEATSSVDPGADRTESGARPVAPPDPEPAGPESDPARRPERDAPAPQDPVGDDDGEGDGDEDSDDGDDGDEDSDDDD